MIVTALSSLVPAYRPELHEDDELRDLSHILRGISGLFLLLSGPFQAVSGAGDYVPNLFIKMKICQL